MRGRAGEKGRTDAVADENRTGGDGLLGRASNVGGGEGEEEDVGCGEI